MNERTFEENNRLDGEKVFRDPVLDYVHVDHQIILDLINSKEVQRLRRIKQLGTAQYTFHGAEHSRFQHSLGVYELARRIINIFSRKFPTKWDDSERLVTLCAALLHDIGHGPFSHAFEKIFHTDHEKFTTEIILDESTQVNQILSKVSSDFPNKVASVITQDYPNKTVVQLISSQLDVDRMDYLLRDAYYTGVKYGSFDLDRIMRVMRPYDGGISFASQGMHAVEDYIVCRYQMYMQVYFHPASRGMEVTLDSLLKQAKKLYDEKKLYQDFPLLTPFFQGTYSLEDYLALDDSVLMTAINLWTQNDNAHLSQLARMFFNRKPLKSIRYNGDSKSDLAKVEKLRDIIGQLSYDREIFTKTNSSLDISYDYELGGKAPIWISYPDGSLTKLGNISDIAKVLGDSQNGDHRLYVPREFIKGPDESTGLNVFKEKFEEFSQYVKNGEIINDNSTKEIEYGH